MSSGCEMGFKYCNLVRIDGNKRTTGDSATSFTMNLSQSLQNIQRVSFVSAVFPNNIYNIRAGVNNIIDYVFSISSTATEYTGSITPGYYSITQLIAAVNTVIAGQVPSTAFGNSTDLTYKVYLNVDSGADYMKLLNRGNGSVWSALGWNNVPVNTGASTGPGVTISPGSNVEAPALPQLAGTTEVYVQSVALAPGHAFDESGTVTSTCIGIPVQVPFGSIQTYECKVDSLCQITYPTPRNIQSIDIQVVDRTGTVVDLNGGNFKLDVRVWYNQL